MQKAMLLVGLALLQLGGAVLITPQWQLDKEHHRRYRSHHRAQMHHMVQKAGSECFKKAHFKHAHLSLLDTTMSESWAAMFPGTGLGKIEPFKMVLKDGFMKTTCVKDYMFTYGDKFYKNKHEYNQGGVSNVSIVHYNAIIPKEDKESMTPKVCFNFCRTVPNMGYFGILNGRECYCTPYFKAMESDSTQCDAPCEGSPTEMCGGKSKSTIFSMHMCDDTEQVLEDAEAKGDDLEDTLDHYLDWIEGYSRDMQDYAEMWQESFGQAGDPAASDLMQLAKIFAGEIEKNATNWEDKIEDVTDDLEDDADDILEDAGGDFTSFKYAKAADDVNEKFEAMFPKLKKAIKASKALKETVHPKTGVVFNMTMDAPESQYRSVMYFVDKAFVVVPSTCTGKMVGEPLLYLNVSECAMACDRAVHDCTAFSLFTTKGGKNGLCFLFSELESATYYTKCDKTDDKKSAFLQKEKPGSDGLVTCMAKLSKYEGTTLKPNPSGKCKQCLKEAQKADRCFEWPKAQDPYVDSELTKSSCKCEPCLRPPNKC